MTLSAFALKTVNNPLRIIDYKAESEFQLQRERNELTAKLGEMQETVTRISQQRQAACRVFAETRKLIDELSLRRLPALYVRPFLKRVRAVIESTRTLPSPPRGGPPPAPSPTPESPGAPGGGTSGPGSATLAACRDRAQAS